MNTAKKQCTHAITQFELTNNLLNNLQQFKLTPVAKLVLLYLSSCYNPKHSKVFPKQKTIALKLGVSEVSVTRAICELHKEGLVISERNISNSYILTQKTTAQCAQKMIDDNYQKDTKENINLTPSYIEQKKETNKEPIELEDYKILKDYAIKHNAKNIEAYINTLKKNGSAEKILKEVKKVRLRSINAEKESKQYLENIKEYHKTSIYADEWDGFKALGELLKKNKAIRN